MINTYHSRLLSKKKLTHDVYIFTFAHDANQPLQFVAGQYLILHVPQSNNETARRLYSIASPTYQKDSFELLVQVFPNGVASEYLLGLQIGDTVKFQGPAGIFTLKDSPNDIVFLATGTGYAPMRSMILELFKNKTETQIHLYWGFATLKNMYYYEELLELASKHANFHFTVCLSREETLPSDATHLAKGRITAVWETTLYPKTTPESFDYYICSGREVVESLKQYLLSKDIPKEYIHSEKY